MAYQNPLSNWLDSTWNNWCSSYERNEAKIKFWFATSIIVCPMFFSLLATGVAEMMPLWGILFAISLYVLVVTGLLILKNSSKTGVNKTLKNLEQKSDMTNALLEAIAEKMGVDVTDIKKKAEEERNERDNKPQ